MHQVGTVIVSMLVPSELCIFCVSYCFSCLSFVFYFDGKDVVSACGILGTACVREYN